MDETETQTDSHDPNDTRQISFIVSHADSEWIDKRLEILKEYDPGFYARIIGIGDDKYMYKITTQHKHFEHDEFKKFMFQLVLRFGDQIKLR